MSRGDTRVALPVMPVRQDRRSGFTLLELVVVLGIMGLAMAIVAPSLVLRAPSPEESMQRVVASARRVAMQRAQTVTLDVDEDGGWRVMAAAHESTEVALSGALDERPLGEVHLLITPLGLCHTTAAAIEAAALPFDPLTCSPRRLPDAER